MDIARVKLRALSSMAMVNQPALMKKLKGRKVNTKKKTTEII
jgi:hypothetical protein